MSARKADEVAQVVVKSRVFQWNANREQVMAREKAANNKSAKVKAAELLAQMGNQPSPIDEETRKTRLKTLIKLGKERGFLTYAEVNDHLPDDVVDAA